jgi:hypothetical protein
MYLPRCHCEQVFVRQSNLLVNAILLHCVYTEPVEVLAVTLTCLHLIRYLPERDTRLSQLLLAQPAARPIDDLRTILLRQGTKQGACKHIPAVGFPVYNTPSAR